MGLLYGIQEQSFYLRGLNDCRTHRHAPGIEVSCHLDPSSVSTAAPTILALGPEPDEIA
jgi:hypothetical protein